MDDLKPCPFCGGEAVWREDPGVCGVLFGLVVRHTDHCHLTLYATDKAKAIAAWNTRHQPKENTDATSD